jgi:hypothetical protein
VHAATGLHDCGALPDGSSLGAGYGSLSLSPERRSRGRSSRASRIPDHHDDEPQAWEQAGLRDAGAGPRTHPFRAMRVTPGSVRVCACRA